MCSRKYFYFFIFIATFFHSGKLNAQSEFVSKFKYNGFALDVQSRAYRGVSNETNYNELSRFVSQNAILDSSRNIGARGYGPASSNASQLKHIPFTMGAKMFFSTDVIHKRSEVFIGFRYGFVELLQMGLMERELKELRTFVDANTGQEKSEKIIYNKSYYMNITANTLYLPLGFNLVSDKSKRFWFAAGLEICPIFNIAHVFSAYYVLTGETFVLDKDETIDIGLTAIRPRGVYEEIESQKSSERLKGVDISAYVAFPVSVNFRVSKNWKFFRHLNLSVTAAPGYFESYSRFWGARSVLTLNMQLGFRYVV